MTENTNDDTTWMEYLSEVAIEAKGLGYTVGQVGMFQKHIQRCWLDHVSVGDCVEGLFND